MKDYNETTDQITLTLDDDSELLCDVIATFPATVNGKEQMYIALIPADAEPEDDIFLYRFILYDLCHCIICSCFYFLFFLGESSLNLRNEVKAVNK